MNVLRTRMILVYFMLLIPWTQVTINKKDWVEINFFRNTSSFGWSPGQNTGNTILIVELDILEEIRKSLEGKEREKNGSYI